jgi:hypothetical protein
LDLAEELEQRFGPGLGRGRAAVAEQSIGGRESLARRERLVAKERREPVEVGGSGAERT